MNLLENFPVSHATMNLKFSFEKENKILFGVIAERFQVKFEFDSQADYMPLVCVTLQINPHRIFDFGRAFQKEISDFQEKVRIDMGNQETLEHFVNAIRSPPLY